MIYAILFAFLLFAQNPPYFVALTSDIFPLSTPTNPGWYNFYRMEKSGDYCVGSPAWVGHVQQTYVNGLAVKPTFNDASVAAGKTYCYSSSFIYTPSGTPTPV